MQGIADTCADAARIATGLLGWTPEEFWQATPQDLRLAIEGRLGRSAAAHFGQAELAGLMARFPDETRSAENGGGTGHAGAENTH